MTSTQVIGEYLVPKDKVATDVTTTLKWKMPQISGVQVCVCVCVCCVCMHMCVCVCVRAHACVMLGCLLLFFHVVILCEAPWLAAGVRTHQDPSHTNTMGDERGNATRKKITKT